MSVAPAGFAAGVRRRSSARRRGGEHVVLADAAGRAAAVDVREVDRRGRRPRAGRPGVACAPSSAVAAPLPGASPGRARARSPARAQDPSHGARRRPRRRRSGRCTCPTVTVSPASARISVTVPEAGAGHLGVDLVRGDLDDRLVGLDRVADRLGPLEHDALGDRLAHRRHDDVDGLGGAASAGAAGSSPPASWLCAAAGAEPLAGAISASTAPTPIVSPSAACSLTTVPAIGAGTSASTLSVEISTSVSSAETESPSVLVPFQHGALADRVTHRRHDDFHRRRVYRHWNRDRPYRVARLCAVVPPRRSRRCPRTDRCRR